MSSPGKLNFTAVATSGETVRAITAKPLMKDENQ
jgi:hypothetical protein